jgi:hypothetical protein
MAVCLLPEKVAAFRQALKDKTLNISDLINMTTEERTNIFKEFAGDNAKDVNTLFEQKLVLKNRIAGLKNWASKIGEVGKYSPEGQTAVDKALADYRAAQQERIFSPKEDQAFLNDLADKKLGVHVSRDVAAKVFELQQKADALKEQGAKLSGVSDAYLNAKQELDHYVQSQKPVGVFAASAKDVATIMRNNLLLNPSTPIKTVTSQIVNSAIDLVTRRIGQFSLRGGNPDLVKQANSEAWDTFRQTGQNTAAMESMDDMYNMLGEHKNFEPPPEATTGDKIGMNVANTINKVARASTKVAITYEHQYAFTKIYQKAFFDMSNLMSTKMAESEGLTGTEANARAAEIFKDAARIEPQTDEGAIVRQQSQMQAARVTSTNQNFLSDIAMVSKNVLNKYGMQYGGGIPWGDLVVPIAKIPADVIYNGIENAGLGIPSAIKDIYEGRAKIQSTDLGTRYEGMAQFANGVQKAARIGGTMGAAYLLANSIPKTNFKQDQYGTTYVKIGSTWINMEYFSAISPAFAGFMTMRAKGAKDFSNGLADYVVGAGKQFENAPGLNDLVSIISNPTKYAQNFFTSRGVPAFIPNLLNSRPINRLFFGAHGVEPQTDVNKDLIQNPHSTI